MTNQLTPDAKIEAKAKEIVLKIYRVQRRPLISFWSDIHFAKKAAMICVQEIINAFDDCHCQPILQGTFSIQDWEMVKQHIEKLTDKF